MCCSPNRSLAIRLGALLLALPVTASAAPEHVRISWCGGDSATTMCITWSDPGGGGNQVQYGFSQSLTESASANAFSAPAPLGTVYEAELVNLAPNTQYEYRVGGSGGPWSSTYTFKTGPNPADPCVPFRFTVLGDNRSQDESGADVKWNAILGEAIDHEPSFVLNTGDLVKDGDQPQQWEDYLEKTDPIQAYFPLFPSIGNHDDDKIQGEGALYNLIHQLPRNASSNTEDFYHFTYGDAIFVSLTSQNFANDAFAQQAAWLDQVLTENPRRWKFVYFHHPPYTGFADVFGLELGHPPNEKGQNAALVPVFDKHHVDIVFNGHNHWYQRFAPMAGGGGSDQGVPVSSPDKGTIYMITGGAGALTFDFDIGDFQFDPLEFICPSATGTEVCDGRHHYVVVGIDKNELSLEVWATAAQNFDTDPSNIELIDSLSITKTDPISCVSPPDPVEPGPEVGDMAEMPPVAEPPPVVEAPPVVEPMDMAEEPNVAEPMEPTPDVAQPPPVDVGGGTDGSDSTDGTGASTGTDGTDASDSTDGITGQDGTTGPGFGTTGTTSTSTTGSEESGGCSVSDRRSDDSGPIGLVVLTLGLLVFQRTRKNRLWSL